MFNILRTATIRNATYCRHDNRKGYEIAWDQNDDFKGYEEMVGLTSAVAWDSKLTVVSTSGTCYIGPSQDQSPVDATAYNIVRVNFRIETQFGIAAPTVGQIQFQTTDDPIYDSNKVIQFELSDDNAYHEYVIDASQVKKWNGDVSRIRIYPFINGYPGTLIHLKYLRVESDRNFTCDTTFNGSLCNRYSQYSHPCPWVGAGGSVEGAAVGDDITIIKGVNDRLVVNINSYGAQSITLTPRTGVRLSDIAADIEDKLSNIAIGGYAGVKVEAVLGKLKITADDTREASSTVVVADTQAARTLGFFNGSGIKLAIELGGEDTASRYEPAGSIMLSKAEISQLYKDDALSSDSGIKFDPRRYFVQAGRDNFSQTYKDKKVDFRNKTIIDFNNPVSNTGVIVNTQYSGDGNKNTELRIFRPLANGTLKFVSATNFGIPTDGAADRVFELKADIRVRKGDFLGLYNGRLDAGKLQELPNHSYFIYDGDLITDLSEVPEINGRGDSGLRIFAHGAELATEAVLDVIYEQPQQIEKLRFVAEEETRKEYTNLSHVKSGGPNNGPYVDSTTGVDKFGDQAPPLVDLGAITDGVIFDTNTLSEALHPSWLDTSFEPADKFNQTSFSFTLDFARGVPVFFNIYRIKLYFRDPNNVKFFGVQYPITTDDNDNNRYWGFVAPKYSSVSLEGKLLEPNNHPLYDNPIRPTVETFLDSYQFLEYRTIDLEFEPVRARSIKYEVKNYFPETDTFKATYSNFTLAPSPYVLEAEVFAVSEPTALISDNFQLESSPDGANYYLHTNFYTEGETSVSYIVGYPVRALRISIKPNSPLTLRGVSADTSKGTTIIDTGHADNALSLNVAKDDFESYEQFSVLNDSDSTFNYYVNISPQKGSPERCLIWNKLGSSGQVEFPEIGGSPSVYKRPKFYLRESNYSYLCPAYIVNPFWLINKKCYITYDSGSSYTRLGSILTDYNPDTYVTSINQLHATFINTHILIDLGDVYALDTLQLVGVTGFQTFANVSFSNLDVAEPTSLSLSENFQGTKAECRWLRITAPSKAPGTPDTQTHALAFIRASLDASAKINRRKLPWLPAPWLTNYKTNTLSSETIGEGVQGSIAGFNNYYAVNLDVARNISNVIVGPSSLFSGGNFDYDAIAPGGAGSLYTSSSNRNAKLAYSRDTTNDPRNVVWDLVNEPPSGQDKWVLLKAISGIYDEVIIQIEDNEPANKPSFGSPRWWTSTNATSIVRDYADFKEGTYSMSFSYPANVPISDELLQLEHTLGIDHHLARRDYLRFWIYISDIDDLDLENGFFSIGRAESQSNGGLAPIEDNEKDLLSYYKWNFSDLSGGLRSGWNQAFLPFTDNFKIGEPYFTRDNLLSRSSTDVSGRSRFRWFRINTKFVNNNKAVTIKLNGFDIERAKFVDSAYGKGLYLTESEYAKFPVNNFNPLLGTIEFWINPDWSKVPGCNSCQDPRDHAIFRLFNSDRYVLGLFMTGFGLRVYVSDGNKNYYLSDQSALRIERGQDAHIALSWDLLGQQYNSGIRLFINNQISSVFEAEAFYAAEFKPNTNAVLMFGGIAWDGVVGELSSSVDGSIHNVRLYNYAIDDFSFSLNSVDLPYVRTSDELIEVSTDGINFFGNQDRGNGLPIYVPSVGPGERFTVYVKNKNIGETQDKGQSKTSPVEIIKARIG